MDKRDLMVLAGGAAFTLLAGGAAYALTRHQAAPSGGNQWPGTITTPPPGGTGTPPPGLYPPPGQYPPPTGGFPPGQPPVYTPPPQGGPPPAVPPVVTPPAPAVPGKVTGVQVIGVSPTQVRVKWNRQPIAMLYQVIHPAYLDRPEEVVAVTSGTEVIIGGGYPNSPYHVWVQAVGPGGVGPKSDLAGGQSLPA